MENIALPEDTFSCVAPHLKPTQEQIFRVQVSHRPTETEAHGSALVKAAHQLGITPLDTCQIGRLFFLQGQLTLAEADRLAAELLVDPVTETFVVTPEVAGRVSVLPHPTPTIEVTLLPGVTDPAAENLVRAAHLLGLTGLTQAATGYRYTLTGSLTEKDLQRLSVEVFSNPVIQRVAINRAITPPFVPYQQTDETVETISLCEATDDEMATISSKRRLALNLAEMQAIRAYYRAESREPTDVELEMLAQTWSEHCVHKSFKATITYTGPEPGQPPDSPPVKQEINGLLKTYLRAATEKVAKPWVRSAFVDNAGIIKFDDTWDLAFKLETHNHPSALEPFGGANTGIGGVVRDVLGVSARPIANTDVLCFGPPDLSESELPTGVLHPCRIADGVVHGIEDYGNKMGIPTVNGAILYHPGYTANPLVFCGCLGILPHHSHPTAAESGDLIVVIGGRTGRDGLRGATFSSMEMDQTTGQIAGSAVQIGHPINEKQVQEVVLRARNERLYHAITDCGAGGLSSAVGEMAEGLGAEVQLQTVPLKYPGLRPWEIWLSEAQERMVLAVPPANWPRIQEICAGQDVAAICIGRFEASGRLRLHYRERLVGDLDLDFLHNGIPVAHLEAVWQPPSDLTGFKNLSGLSEAPTNLTETLLTLLAQPDIRSKEAVVRRYDHEVQGGTAVKPLVGIDNHGPGDATVLVPFDVQTNHHWRAVALSVGICPLYGELDPYAMAWAAIDEAMRNLVAVGADPDQVALLDNFCWGNPNLPDRLGSLVRCAQGCYDAALAYQVPFISGKDSLNNEYTGADGQKHAIPGTLLISALGLVPDVNHTVTMDLKQAGNLLYIIGETRDELGGSHYQLIIHNSQFTIHNSPPPQPVRNALDRFRSVHQALSQGLVQACHDCSEGGLGVALAEMCLAGLLGAEINLAQVPGAANISTAAQIFFSESSSRFIVEIRPQDAATFETILKNAPHARIGHVLTTPELRVTGLDRQTIIHTNIVNLENAWRGHITQRSKGEIAENRLHSTPHPRPSAAARLQKPPRVFILHANGVNRDREAALACQLAGADPEIVHINQLLAGERRLLDYHMLVVPGGFSYGDDLGAGVLWALDLRHRLGDDVTRFVASGRPVLGICNGFQVLVKSGLLPGLPLPEGENQGESCRAVTLTFNHSGHFECRWVYLQPNPHSPNIFTDGLTEPIYCPVAHGEGRLAVTNNEVLVTLQTNHLNALTYVNADGSLANYPLNPNGSAAGIAGLCNPAGNVLGLMPHPEDHIFPWQRPRWQRGEMGMDGLRLFKNGVKRA
ncbi:MAG: phosphoribosylformylglycinamidine synthase subunit PurL [Anaerolineae bacterium]|nr:phosphoribosylformylglycinamidine synthase subunit PurL [Anaerolineae bacterium]